MSPRWPADAARQVRSVLTRWHFALISWPGPSVHLPCLVIIWTGAAGPVGRSFVSRGASPHQQHLVNWAQKATAVAPSIDRRPAAEHEVTVLNGNPAGSLSWHRQLTAPEEGQLDAWHGGHLSRFSQCTGIHWAFQGSLPLSSCDAWTVAIGSRQARAHLSMCVGQKSRIRQLVRSKMAAVPRLEGPAPPSASR